MNEKRAYTTMKRVFDLIASFLGLIILSPLMIVVIMMIKLLTPGPVFFSQARIGRYGKPFMLYKFRTMKVNNGGNTVSVRGEDRITPLGAILRRYKIDELPELWNIFRGDMSFVGPRPDIAEYINILTGEELRILELRPGLTSPASIKYVNEEELLASAPDPIKYYNAKIWPDKVRMNLEYCQERSFWGDILLIIKTLFRTVK